MGGAGSPYEFINEDKYLDSFNEELKKSMI